MRTLIIILIFSLYASSLYAQSKKNDPLIRSGNDLYQQKQYSKAADEYAKAVEADPSDSVAKYNQAAALYKQDQKVEAAKLYSSLINTVRGKDFHAKTYYNK